MITQFRNRKIALLGSDAKSLSEIYDLDDSWEIWSLNNLYLKKAFQNIKFTRWFELHKFTKRWWGKYLRRDAEEYGKLTIMQYMKDLASLDIPVYMQKEWKIIPKSKIFPFEQIMKVFQTQYFGCSFAWMIALILLEHMEGLTVDTIGLYGVELQGIEYYEQLPTTVHFLGMTKGSGINIVIPETSKLLKMDWIYAYDEDSDLIDLLYADKGKAIIQEMVLFYQQLVDKYL